MIVFETFDTYTFKLNGIKYVKNFLAVKMGATHIAIHNAFDTRFQLVPSTHYNQFTVDGASFDSQSELMGILAPLLFAKQIVDIASLSADTPTLQEVHDASLDNDLNTCRVNTYSGIQFYYSEGDSSSVITPQFVLVSPDHFNSSYSIQDKGFFYNRASFNVGITFEEVPNSLVYNRYFQIPSTEIDVNAGLRTIATREWVAENTPLPSLQNVLEVGNVADSSIILDSGSFTSIYSFSGIEMAGSDGGLSINDDLGILSVNIAGTKQCQFNYDGLKLQTNTGGKTTLIQNSTTTNENIILNTPNLTGGTYTLATEEFVQDQLGGIGPSITNTSELVNDGDGLNAFATIDLLPTSTSQLYNDGDGSGSFVVDYSLSPVAYSGEYAELNNTPDLSLKSDKFKQVKTITGTTYSITNADVDNILHFTSASAITLTIASGLTSNSRFEGKQLGTGQISFAASSTTLRKASSENLKTAEQYSAFAIDWIGTNEYMIYGKLEQV